MFVASMYLLSNNLVQEKIYYLQEGKINSVTKMYSFIFQFF